MQYRDEDINFETFGWQRFEELCFDLLHKYQYYGLTWNRVGPTVAVMLKPGLGSVIRLLYFMKRSDMLNTSTTLERSANKLAEKFAQARVEQIDHFLIITNSYTYLKVQGIG